MSKKRIKAFDFTEEVSKIIEQYGSSYGGILPDLIKKSMDKVCTVATNKLQSVNRFSPNGNPSGAYSKDWTFEIKSDGRYKRKAVVFNEDHYRLTHLLENGHALKRGGRTYGRVQAYTHIFPINEEAQKDFYDEVVKAIEQID